MSKDVDIMFWLIQAVDCRKVVKFKYGDDKTERKAEVYVIGVNQMDELIIRAFDLTKNDWRLFLVSKIIAIEKTTVSFKGFRSGYNPKDKSMKKVLRRVK